MDPRLIPAGSSPEYQGNGRPLNEPGVYYHPGADKFIETGGVRMPDGSVSYANNEGQVQGDAFVQIGYHKADEKELEEYKRRLAAKQKEFEQNASRKTFVMADPNQRQVFTQGVETKVPGVSGVTNKKGEMLSPANQSAQATTAGATVKKGAK